jgi:hypothetical protein
VVSATPDSATRLRHGIPRSLDRLAELGLVRIQSTETGNRGPQRSIVTTTPAGNRATHAWLNRPVAHVREVRSELLVKLGLLLRRGQPPTGLIAAQRQAFAPVQAALEQQQRTGTGFGQLLACWRMENMRAAMRFLDEVGDG